jgi:hypothetical protein
MKKISFCLVISVLILYSCVQNQSGTVETLPTTQVTLFGSYNFQMPNGFNLEDEHNWLYQREKKVGRLYIAYLENPEGDLILNLDEFQNSLFEGKISDYEFLGADTVSMTNKEGVIRNYRKNENENKNNPYAVYTYHSVGILKYDNCFFKIKSLSLGFNLNSTTNKIFSSFEKKTIIPQVSNNNSKKVDYSNMTVFNDHSLAVSKKYKFIGDNSPNTLQMKFKNPTNNITYYLTSEKLGANMDIGYYLSSYEQNQRNGGMTVTKKNFLGKEALYGKMNMQGAYIYQLHFVSNGRGQTIQMLAGKPSDTEFENYTKDVKIID